MVSAPEHSPLLSLIPEQGPFHMTLKANETACELHIFVPEIRLIAGLKCWDKTQCKDIYLCVLLLITMRAR